MINDTTRVNLICNGMMLFMEKGERLQIVIPYIDSHVRKFCSDPEPTKENLKELPAGNYIFEPGVAGGNAKLRDLLDSFGYVVLDAAKVKYVEPAQEQNWAVIDVPKPHIIRLYRASEPTDLATMLGNCSDCVVRTPTLAHDIVVLSYLQVRPGAAVSFGRKGGDPMASTQAIANTPVSWILYSNEEQPFGIQNAIRMASQELADVLAEKRHKTTLNDFIVLTKVSGAQAAVNSTLALSGIGLKDGPPTSTPFFITPQQMLLYHELPADRAAAFPLLDSGEPGCSGGAIAE